MLSTQLVQGLVQTFFFWNHISYAFSEGPYGIAWSIQKHLKKKFQKILHQKISYSHVSAIIWDLLKGFQFF